MDGVWQVPVQLAEGVGDGLCETLPSPSGATYEPDLCDILRSAACFGEVPARLSLPLPNCPMLSDLTLI